MQKILITLTQAVTVKNMMRTGVAEKLLTEPEVELLFLARNKERVERYKKEFPYPRTTYIDLDYVGPTGMWERVFVLFKKYGIRTKTTDLRRRMVAHDSRRYLHYVAGLLLNRLCAHRIVRQVVRALDARLVHDPRLAAFLKEQAPDLVVLTNLFDDVEISLLREARRQGIKTVGFINSWDRLTTRWMVRLLPDHLVVYNESVRNDALRHADMPAERITLVGVPQYDRYLTEDSEPRDTFFARKGLDLEKRLILVAPMGATFSDSDWLMIDYIQSLIDTGAVPNAQMLVRFQPNDFLDEAEIAKRPWLHYDKPGIRFGTERGGDWDMTEEDLRDLNASLKHAGVLVTYTSSISIDAAVAGTPVININFLFKPITEMLKAPTFYYGTEHHSNAVSTGGFRLVTTREQLLGWIQKYLDTPDTDANLRRTLAEQQCYKLDGRSAERLAKAIQAALPHTR